MKILLTGANGFLGKSVSKKLNKFYKIKKTDLNNLDITKKNKINSYLKKYKFDLVVHCAAAKGSVDSIKNPETYVNTNFLGTYNILEAMRLNGCKKIIFISSSGLYKNGNNIKNENDDIFCKNPYALGKFLSEETIKHYCNIYNFNAICIRPNLISGYGLFKDNLIYDVVKSIKKNNIAEVYGNGKHIREFTHPDDISDFILKIIKVKFKGFQIFNLTSNRTQIIKLINKIIRIMETGNLKFLKTKKQAFSLVLNDKKIKKTGWKPKKNLDFIIKEIISGVNNE